MTLDDQELTMNFLLPVSKNDPEARGCTRAWPCVCHDSAGDFIGCPYHTLEQHRHIIAEKLGFHGLLGDMPLFPDASGSFCTPP